LLQARLMRRPGKNGALWGTGSDRMPTRLRRLSGRNAFQPVEKSHGIRSGS